MRRAQGDTIKHLKIAALVAAIALVCSVSGCAAFTKDAKTTVHTVAEIATFLCQAFGQQHPDVLNGLSIEAFCAVEENVAPFVEQVTAAQKTAGGEIEAAHAKAALGK